MPTIKTGNQEWDQNLNTLGNALFPDPSKAAQAYYYGSESRKAQLESNKIINQQNWQNRFMQGQNWGPGVPQPAAPTWNQPDLPGAFPIVAPPSNLPMSSAIVPGATGVAGPSGGQIVQPHMTPAQAVANTPAAAAPYLQGTPQPVGPPSAVSPPSPQNTTSNGQVPTNDPVSGVFHPASVNSTGGGVQMAGPANPNGSPAQMPFDLQKYVAMAVAAGMDANQAALQGQAYVTQAGLQGVLPMPQVNQALAGTGQAAPLVADIGARAAVTGHQLAAGATVESAKIGAGATIGAANIRERGAKDIAGMATTFVPDPDPAKAAQGLGSFVPLIQQQGPGGYRGTNPTAVSATVTPGQYVTPGGGITTAAAGTAIAQGMPAASTSTDQNTAQTLQRIRAITDPDQRAQALQEFQATQALPKDLDPKKQAEQQGADYLAAQRIYSVPQTPAISLGVKDPVAFDNQAEEDIARRAFELSRRAGNQFLIGEPSKAREAAINDLQKHPTADGRRLPTPAEVNAMRIPARTWIATLGTSGDERIDTFVSPYNKPGQGTDHMMIRPMTPAEIQAKVAAARGEAKGAAATGPAPTATTTPLSTAYPPPPGPTTAASPAQLYGGPVPGAGPAPSIGARISQGYQAIQNIGSSGNPTPQTPAQLYGSQPAPPGAVAAPVSGGAPPGALGPAAPGLPEGAPVYGPGGVVGVNRGGWVYPPR